MQQRYAAHPQASPYGTTFTPGHSERLPAPVRPTSVKTVTPVDQPLVTLQLSLAHARASACVFLWFEKHVSMQVPRGVPWGKLQRHHNNPRVWTCPHCGQAFGTNYRHYYKYHYQGRCGSSQCDQGASVPVDEANPSAVPSAVPAGTPVEPGPFGTEDYAAAELQQQFVELGLDANQQLHTLERLVEARRAAEAAAAERLQQQEQLVQQQLQEQLATSSIGMKSSCSSYASRMSSNCCSSSSKLLNWAMGTSGSHSSKSNRSIGECRSRCTWSSGSCWNTCYNSRSSSSKGCRRCTTMRCQTCCLPVKPLPLANSTHRGPRQLPIHYQIGMPGPQFFRLSSTRSCAKRPCSQAAGCPVRLRLTCCSSTGDAAMPSRTVPLTSSCSSKRACCQKATASLPACT